LPLNFTSPPRCDRRYGDGGKGRPSGADVDFVITAEDYKHLARQYPDALKDLGGDLSVCVFEFEIWKSICLFDYEFLSVRAQGQDGYRVISLEKLLFLKALAMKVEKYHRDLELIVARVLKDRYEAASHSP
jgi:hypothetical protein